MTVALVSYDELKDLLGLTKTSISDYPALDVLVNSVQYAIEEYLGRLLELNARTETLYIGGTSSQMVSLPGIPVSSITSVTITQGQVDTVSTDYDIVDYGIRLHAKLQRAKVVVVYEGGLDDIPTSVNRAALMQTAYEWQAKDQIGAESVSTDGGMVQRPALGLLKEVKRMLNSEKHPLRLM